MRATKAYIASAGTAAVMLAASIGLFAMVSAFVAFGAWPEGAQPTRIDQVVLDAIERPTAPPVAVSRTARTESLSATTRRARGGQKTGAQVHRTSGTGTIQTPAAGGTLGGTTRGTGGGAAGGGGGKTPTTTVPQLVTETTQPLIQNAPPPVQDVAKQVTQVVDQVGGAVPPPPPPVDKLLDGTLSTLK
jgi:hypothetical protein